MAKKHSTFKDQVEFGLKSVDASRSVKVSLRDLLYLYGTLNELARYFHQPDHYKNTASLRKFIGNKEEGAYQAIHKCVYDKMMLMIPVDIKNRIDSGDFDNPSKPFYYDL